jgi:glycosyltransferase involved in cell wall biosynthesis
MAKVSVMMICFNHEAFIEEAVASAAEQAWDDLEVIVADDASTDRTPALLRDLEARYRGRVRAILNPENLGITRNCNVAWNACVGELVCFLGGDDVLLPGKVAHQARLMLADPGCALSFHDMEVFGEGESWLFSSRHPSYEGDAATIARQGTYFGAPSVMIRRSPGLRFDERIPVTSDWLFWIDAVEARRGTVRDAGGTYTRYRRHAHNVSAREDGVLEERLLTLRLAEERYPRLRTACREGRARLQAAEAFRQAGTGRPAAAARALARGALASPVGLARHVVALARARARA